MVNSNTVCSKNGNRKRKGATSLKAPAKKSKMNIEPNSNNSSSLAMSPVNARKLMSGIQSKSLLKSSVTKQNQPNRNTRKSYSSSSKRGNNTKTTTKSSSQRCTKKFSSFIPKETLPKSRKNASSRLTTRRPFLSHAKLNKIFTAEPIPIKEAKTTIKAKATAEKSVNGPQKTKNTKQSQSTKFKTEKIGTAKNTLQLIITRSMSIKLDELKKTETSKQMKKDVTINQGKEHEKNIPLATEDTVAAIHEATQEPQILVSNNNTMLEQNTPCSQTNEAPAVGDTVAAANEGEKQPQISIRNREGMFQRNMAHCRTIRRGDEEKAKKLSDPMRRREWIRSRSIISTLRTVQEALPPTFCNLSNNLYSMLKK